MPRCDIRRRRVIVLRSELQKRQRDQGERFVTAVVTSYVRIDGQAVTGAGRSVPYSSAHRVIRAFVGESRVINGDLNFLFLHCCRTQEIQYHLRRGAVFV